MITCEHCESTWVKLEETNARLKYENDRMSVLVDYDRLRLIMHIHQLEDGIWKLRRFLRREDHDEKAEILARKHLERFIARDDSVHVTDLIAIITDAFSRGASYAIHATSARWQASRMPRQPEEERSPGVAEAYLRAKDAGADGREALGEAIARSGSR